MGCMRTIKERIFTPNGLGLKQGLHSRAYSVVNEKRTKVVFKALSRKANGGIGQTESVRFPRPRYLYGTLFATFT